MSDRKIPGTEVHFVIDKEEDDVYLRPSTTFLMEWTNDRTKALRTRVLSEAERAARFVHGRILTTYTAEHVSEPY